MFAKHITIANGLILAQIGMLSSAKLILDKNFFERWRDWLAFRVISPRKTAL